MKIKFSFVVCLLVFMSVGFFSLGQDNDGDPPADVLDCRSFKIINTKEIKTDSIRLLNSPCTIYSGTADFSNIIFDSVAMFSKSIFNPETKFVKTVFHLDCSFDNSRFLSPVTFEHAGFNDFADFKTAKFYGPVSFAEARFDTMANFFGARLDSIADFSRTVFKEQVSFFATQFNSPAVFQTARMGVRSYFVRTQFGDKADFSDAVFNSLAYFRQAEFKRDVNFAGTEFSKLADFGFARFLGRTTFENAIMPDTLYLNHVKDIADLIDLTSGKYRRGRVYLDITGADIRKVKLDYQYFKLFFSDSYAYTQAEKNAVFTGLMDVQKKYGFTEGYEKLDKDFHEFTYLAKNEYFTNWIQKHWLDYGYNPGWLIGRNIAILLALLLVARFLVIRMRSQRAMSQT